MRINRGEDKTPPGAFLSRLARDKSGNTLAIMAMAMIPMTALAGSGVDAARLYVVKVRLQQACDAGVLAGRKFMKEGGGANLNAEAVTNANTFFRNNFKEGWLSTSDVRFTPTKTSNERVAGTASTVVPMTVMKVFDQPDVTVSVVCEARLDVADTDIMFVLDVTGSMACLPSDSASSCSTYAGTTSNQTSYTRPANSATDVTAGYANTTGWKVTEKPGSRIAQLRKAVVDFYDTMDKSKQPNTRVRYGFVPYTSTVNAGAAIMAMDKSYMIGGLGSETWDYQTRRVTADYPIGDVGSSRVYNGKSQSDCKFNQSSRNPASALTYDSNSGQAQRTVERWFTKGPDGTTNLSTPRCATATEYIGPQWTYEKFGWDVSGYVTSASVTDPTKVKAATATWLGCIEERATTPKATSFSDTSKFADLNPDLIPSSRDTRWRPMWPEVTYWRKATTNEQYRSDWQTAARVENGDTSYGVNLSDAKKLAQGMVSCNKPVQRLSPMSKTDVSDYVTAADFVPIGGTYHDVGMIWALRLMSRNGIFSDDNRAQANRNPPKRVIVFLTDGDMAPSEFLYGHYGIEYYDQRVGGGDYSKLKDYHNARFKALCDRAGEMGIDVWTVALGTGKTTELTDCASVEDQALAPDPKDPNALSTAFKKIAKAVANLRVSK